MILSAIKRTNLSDPADIEYDILNGDQLLWLAIAQITADVKIIEAAAATSLVEISGETVCIITACGGENMANWLPLFAHIETYAKNEGCDRVRIYGRRGWSRVLDGYHVEHVVMERQI